MFCDGTQRTDGEITALGVTVETEMLVFMLWYGAGAFVVEFIQVRSECKYVLKVRVSPWKQIIKKMMVELMQVRCEYSRPSVAGPVMARLPPLFRTCS